MKEVQKIKMQKRIHGDGFLKGKKNGFVLILN